MDKDHLFVYGTLRKQLVPGAEQSLLNQCRFVSKAYILGKLFEVKGYPGAVPSSDPMEKVSGELYRLPPGKQLLRQLDQYEECADSFPEPHEYIRQKLTVFIPAGKLVIAWVYVFNRETGGLYRIKSGNYLNHLRLRGVRV